MLKAPDVFIYVNAIMMFISSCLFLKTLVNGLKGGADLTSWMLAPCGVLGNKVNERLLRLEILLKM